MASDPTTLRKRENTRARLLDAAEEIMITKGIGAARIDDVVRAAGFSRGAFYSNYSSMDALMIDLINSRSERITARATEAFDAIDGQPNVDAVMRAIETFRPEAQRMNIMAMEFDLYRMRHPEFAKELGTKTLGELSTLDSFIQGLAARLLERMGRRPTIPIPTISRLLGVFYMDSLIDRSGAGDDGTPFMRTVIEAVLVAFSQPVSPGDACTAGVRTGDSSCPADDLASLLTSFGPVATPSDPRAASGARPGTTPLSRGPGAEGEAGPAGTGPQSSDETKAATESSAARASGDETSAT